MTVPLLSCMYGRALLADMYGHVPQLFWITLIEPSCSWDPATREKALTYLGFLSFVGPTLCVHSTKPHSHILTL